MKPIRRRLHGTLPGTAYRLRGRSGAFGKLARAVPALDAVPSRLERHQRLYPARNRADCPSTHRSARFAA